MIGHDGVPDHNEPSPSSALMGISSRDASILISHCNELVTLGVFDSAGCDKGNGSSANHFSGSGKDAQPGPAVIYTHHTDAFIFSPRRIAECASELATQRQTQPRTRRFSRGLRRTLMREGTKTPLGLSKLSFARLRSRADPSVLSGRTLRLEKGGHLDRCNFFHPSQCDLQLKQSQRAGRLLSR